MAGEKRRVWSVSHDVIYGDLETDEPWRRLDAYLKQVWRRADGRGLTIMAACHDSGGHHTQKVYEFAKERLGRRIWAIKGESAQGGKRNPVWPTKRPSSKSKAQFRPIILGLTLRRMLFVVACILNRQRLVCLLLATCTSRRIGILVTSTNYLLSGSYTRWLQGSVSAFGKLFW